ncbi:Predicted DNA-binding protein with PD1-like DNA-binding motif [Dethiosulfatibacter aminovorans DSM 17477]|uniref:Predicted DNA-binding protein with PD1-like DNA-binding motif n=1 Tax=Dethiosulfatibacter aminovorans DSM 17477 TaxID=1121476 RepID=A0A1M6M3V6_9FIRM|nr:PPC domain-containing DNA-binding protein [Dethiosulfatibacter aminovorans]SHJ78145.1 Predicted DNA-binding protein with PD1-like DNA-binding motif [Dethiosulfatibacter aminovorans DSM 17477]
MKYTEVKHGRTFVLRLEQGDLIPDDIEKFAAEHCIDSGVVYLLGGVDKGSKMVSGPVDGDDVKVNMPLNINDIENVHESIGVGTIFLNEEDKPILHLHAAAGREKDTITGCTRVGVNVWMYMEVVIVEFIDCNARRKVDGKSGFTLLEVGE